MATTKKWYSVLKDKKTLPEGRVQTVTAGHQGICLTHYDGKFSALDNKCPHQGGPLGEGSIENGSYVAHGTVGILTLVQEHLQEVLMMVLKLLK